MELLIQWHHPPIEEASWEDYNLISTYFQEGALIQTHLPLRLILEGDVPLRLILEGNVEALTKSNSFI